MLMQMDAKLDLILEELDSTMAKRRISPEERADWADARRRLSERLDFYAELERRRAERSAARRERLQRFSLGLLGR
jgi:hypothetical protein